jgi:hypothetical protein
VTAIVMAMDKSTIHRDVINFALPFTFVQLGTVLMPSNASQKIIQNLSDCEFTNLLKIFT